MGDELEELFGAFDDEQQSSSSPDGEPQHKKFRLDTRQNENRTEKKTTTIEATGDFNAVMNQPAVSHLLSSVDTRVSAAVSDEATKDKVANREVATGTSHDKTVRSYSAFPKKIPGNHEEAKVLPPSEPAKVYSFPLDPFQQKAVGYIDIDQSVLVAAHTSAGKTAVAEYAIAKSLKASQRVVYTSPIKALSNQKFRDLQEEFSDVGLMTGDITINPEATCLVMTTEILRSMLYRGSELMREVAWVIYDEVHYMRDSERGVVWEESIILLPHTVKFVFLSATIPNASQFADWIAEIHHQPCHVVYTNYRPTPLQHYVFPQGGDGLHLVIDEKGQFREANFQKAMATLAIGSTDEAGAEAMLSSGNSKKRGRTLGANKKKGKGPFADLYRIVKLIMERNLNPVIVFSFSKKDCEKYALALNREDYTSDVEKDLITQVYTNAIESLGEDDRKLPQVEALLPLLKRGIGIHHGGLLPILKEIVEILFSEGLIKTLFATETFSIGINMPAKTVVFTNTRKWDGKDFRYVTSGEYIQMSGRAGRRGKDDRGIVIQILDEKMEPTACKNILYGAADPLNSSYRISYHMLINTMRVDEIDPEYLLRASFHQYQREKEAPGLLAESERLEAEIACAAFEEPEKAELASQYYQMDKQLNAIKQKITSILQKPEYILKFLQPGRLVSVVLENESFGWGVLVSYKKKNGVGSCSAAGNLALSESGPLYSVDIVLGCVDRNFGGRKTKTIAEDSVHAGLLWRGSVQNFRPVEKSDSTNSVSWRIFTVGLISIDRLSAIKLVMPSDFTSLEGRRKIGLLLNTATERFKEGVQLLDPIRDLGVKDEIFPTLLQQAKSLTERLATHELATNFDECDRISIVSIHELQTKKQERARALRDEARGLQTITMKDHLKKMKRVLKKLGLVNASGVIQTKGRAACEINTADELVVVELMFAGVFNGLSIEQCVALMSCMTYDERNKEEGDPASGIKPLLSAPFYKLQEVARTVAKVEISCGIDINEDEFCDKFNPGMMEAVHAWCNGVKFVKVQELTGSFEGTTIRTLRRLEELVRQISSAAKAIGNTELQSKFEKGSDLLKRDIVFCSSLYL